MKMELIQPFINATDSVLCETMGGSTRMTDMTMEPEAHKRLGVAALVVFSGDIEGRIVFDAEPGPLLKLAERFAGGPVTADDDTLRECVCEMANLIIGNAITTLNDQGFRFKVHPPTAHKDELGFASTVDVEALVMAFENAAGKVYMNIALKYYHRRHED
jgi:chemotaxis protein CheX